MKRVFITGATGDVGRAILPMLAKKYHVIALVRDGKQAQMKNVEWVNGDLAHVSSYEKKLRGVYGVIHLAALLRSGDSKKLQQENVDATIALVNAAHAAKCKNIIVFSTTALTQKVLSPYAKSKKKMEEELARVPIAVHVVRPTLVYGKKSHYWNYFESLALSPRAFVFLPNRGRANINPVWNEDVGRGVLTLLTRAPRGMEIHEFCPEGKTTMREFLDLFSSVHGKKPKMILSPPHGVVESTVRALQALSLPVPRSLVSLAAGGSPYLVQPEHFSRVHGLKFKTPRELIPLLAREDSA